MPRDLKQLLADNETAETLRSALDALDEINPPTPSWHADLAALRAELLFELGAIDPQGDLF
jgi:hypothetical protein